MKEDEPIIIYNLEKYLNKRHNKWLPIGGRDRIKDLLLLNLSGLKSIISIEIFFFFFLIKKKNLYISNFFFLYQMKKLYLIIEFKDSSNFE